jgi:hypothetical protein
MQFQNMIGINYLGELSVDDIRVGLGVTVLRIVDLNKLAQNSLSWLALLNIIINRSIPRK